MGRPSVGADTRPGERQLDQFQRRIDSTRGNVKVDVDKSSFDAAATSLRNLSTNYKALGIASAGIASPTAIAGTVGVVSQLSGVLGLIPAAAGAAGLAMGSLKIATSGFADAVKEARDPEKFAEAIGKLSPNAQQAATSIQAMLPALDQLKFTVQDAFFAGFGQQLQQLSSSYLPMFQTTMSQIAASANSAMTEVSQQLQTPAMQGDIAAMTGNMAVAFDKLSGALSPIVSSFVDIGLVGSGFLPQLADGAARAAEAFSQFVGEARASGDMQSWIEGGIAGFKQLGDIIGNIGGILGGFAKAAPEGGGPLGMLQSLTQVANDFINSPAGRGALTSWMTALRDTMSALAPAAGAFLQAIAPIGGVIGTALVTAVQAIAPALTSWFNAMQPVVQQLSGALTPVIQSLGPVLAQMSNIIAGQMVSGIQTILPVLIPFVQQWGQALTSIMPLLPSLLQLAMSALPMVQQAVAVILPPMTQWMNLMANLGNLVIPPLSAAITTMSTVWQASFGTMQNVVSTAWNVMQPVFNAIKTAIDGLLGPLDEIIGLASRLPGVQAAIGTIKGVAGAATTPGAVPGPVIPGLPGVPSSALKPPGTYRTRDGQIRTIPRGTAPIAPAAGIPMTQLPIPPVSTYVAPVTSSGGSSSSTSSKSQFSDANLAPNAARLNDIIAEQFPQIREIGGYRANGGGSNDHPSGRALDIMIPDWDTPEGKALGDQINTWLHQNAGQLGIDSTIWQDFWAPVTGGGHRLGREGANEGHYNHIHAKVSDQTANGDYASPLSATYPDTTAYTSHDPMGSTYGTTGDKSLRDAKQKVDDKQFAIEQAQRKLDELPGDATGSQRAAKEQALAKAKREHADALEDLATAQGKYNDAAAKDPTSKSGSSGFESLGSDLVSGMMEVLGLGGIFKDPTQFGLFKIAKAVMGLDISDGAGGSEGGGLFPGGGGGSGLTSLLSNVPKAFGALNTAEDSNAPAPFMPSMPQAGGGGVVLPGNMMASPFSPTGAGSAAGPGNQPVVDQSVTLNGARFGYSKTEVQDQIRNTHLSQARVPLRTLPTP